MRGFHPELENFRIFLHDGIFNNLSMKWQDIPCFHPTGIPAKDGIKKNGLVVAKNVRSHTFKDIKIEKAHF